MRDHTTVTLFSSPATLEKTVRRPPYKAEDDDGPVESTTEKLGREKRGKNHDKFECKFRQSFTQPAQSGSSLLVVVVATDLNNNYHRYYQLIYTDYTTTIESVRRVSFIRIVTVGRDITVKGAVNSIK